MDTASIGLHAEKNNKTGVIVLDRPKACNALTTAMVEAMATALQRFCDDDAITSVVVRSAVDGTFCAGGDVRAVRQARLEGRHDKADAFYEREFAVNALIARFPKPYASVINVTCFGGGTGITIHGAHRVVGEAALLALPETAIGYLPDVGASYFLNRLPAAIARFLALTGYVLSPEDAISTGLATAFAPASRYAKIEQRLAMGEPIQTILDEMAEAPGEGRLDGHRETVERCFSAGSVAEIENALRRE